MPDFYRNKNNIRILIEHSSIEANGMNANLAARIRSSSFARAKRREVSLAFRPMESILWH